jgi:hypothetical protein
LQIYEDAGISGAKGRDKRPGLDAMMKAVNAKQFDMVAAWSVDRLGRSLTDLLGILQALQEKGRIACRKHHWLDHVGKDFDRFPLTAANAGLTAFWFAAAFFAAATNSSQPKAVTSGGCTASMPICPTVQLT